MSLAAAIDFTGAPESALPAWVAPCVERVVPGLGSTWVHGYTGIDAGRWQTLAGAMAKAVPDACDGGRGKPSGQCLLIAQACVVCRRGPGSEAYTFSIRHGGEAQAWQAMAESALPGTWVEAVCADSDNLTLADYVPRNTSDKGPQAMRKLCQALGDKQFWGALDYLSLTLYGQPLVDNGAPLAEVLAHLERDVERQAGLVAGLGALVG